MNRRQLLRTGAWALAPVAGCLERSCGPHDGFDVGMGSDFFCPEEFQISTGETVRWRNTGSRPHTVTAYESGIPEGAAYFASGGFESPTAARDAWESSPGDWGAIRQGEEYSRQFEIAGRYEYFCVPHERAGMVGTIVVEEDTSESKDSTPTTDTGRR